MNINDYLIWRGDLPISDEYPFNEVDDLILARFSYLPFEKISLNDGDTLEEVAFKMKDVSLFKLPGDEELIFKLGNSHRFKNLKVSDFSINKSKKTEKQFGAITIHCGDFIYVSFIGTDNSIVGWKEDFNLSFMKHIPAQLEGVKYLNAAGYKYSGKIRVGGHSKGGNVSIYASLYADSDVKNRIISVTSYDGPGFYPEIIEDYDLNNVTTFIPQDSVIGRLLEHKGKMVTVKSNNKGLYQHDVYSWEVGPFEFVKVDSVTESSEFINQTIREWLLNTTPQNRKIFVDGVFELFYSSNSSSFKELSKTWTKDISKMMSAYGEIPKEDKKIIGNMLMEFGKASSSVFKKTSKLKIEELQKSLFDKKN